MWKNTFKELGSLIDTVPVLMTEINRMWYPKAEREKMAQIMFETFDVPKFYVSIDAVLALYASGRTTGTVITSGYGTTNISSIYEGYALSHAISRLDIAGNDMTEYLKNTLQDKLKSTNLDISDDQLWDNIKKEMCYVAKDYDMEMKDAEELEKDYNYKLPDGNVVTIKMGKERVMVGETLFQPKLDNDIQEDGTHKLLIKTIKKCDTDIRKELYNNIVLSGGCTMLSGLKERLNKEVRDNVEQGTEIKIIAPPERRLSVWIGGSILGSLCAMDDDDVWMTSKEYDEYGPGIVHRKCTGGFCH